MKKKAFTLIELLVVIAIIAILAAILFPVFAQAKQQAKAAASTSNLKQIVLAEIMYMADFDDNHVIVGSWDSSDPHAWNTGGARWGSWALLIDPYQKNTNINADPLRNRMVNAGEVQRIAGTRFMEYGYNYTYLSPSYCCTWPTPITSISGTAVAQPANTVAFTERTSREMGIWWYGERVGWMIMGTSEAPDCYTVPTHWCSDGWGVGNGWETVVGEPEEGQLTGLNAWRSHDKVISSFTDGHVKTMDPTQLAQGSNWTWTESVGNIVNNDPQKYLWDTAE